MTSSGLVLILGDIGIPEAAASIPIELEQLIDKLKDTDQQKYIVCAGAMGSDSDRTMKWLQSLNAIEIVQVDGWFGLTRNQRNIVRTFGNLKVGISSGYQTLNRVGCPTPATLFPFTGPLDCCITCSESGHSVDRCEKTGCVMIHPGPLTSTWLHLKQSPKVCVGEDISLEGETEQEGDEPGSQLKPRGGDDLTEKNDRVVCSVPGFMLLTYKDDSASLYCYQLNGHKVDVNQVSLEQNV